MKNLSSDDIKQKLLILTFFLSQIILLVACAKNDPTIILDSDINVPGTDFNIRPLIDYQIDQRGFLFLYKVGEEQPGYLVTGSKLSGNQSNEAWMQERLNSQHDLGMPEKITVNNISGYIAQYDGDDIQGELATVWFAVLSTEKQGVTILATAAPESGNIVKDKFIAMVESVQFKQK